jgi:integrase
VISSALTQAVKWGWLEHNVATRTTRPVLEHRELQVPTADEVNSLIDASWSRSPVLGMFVVVAAVTGCRRGELAALRWSDIDGEVLTVRASAYAVGSMRGIKSTKSGRVRRILIGPALQSELAKWRSSCEKTALDWNVPYASTSFVFASRPDGSEPVNVNTMTSSFRSVADGLGLGHVHLHSLRHFAATDLIASGLDVRDAATRLGHSTPMLTLNVYGHATELRQREAAGIGDRVVRRRQA